MPTVFDVMEAIEDAWPGQWASPRWPTRDGLIPWRYCLLLLQRLPRRRALLQLRQVEALVLALSVTQPLSPAIHQSAQEVMTALKAEAQGA